MQKTILVFELLLFIGLAVWRLTLAVDSPHRRSVGRIILIPVAALIGMAPAAFHLNSNIQVAASLLALMIAVVVAALTVIAGAKAEHNPPAA